MAAGTSIPNSSNPGAYSHTNVRFASGTKN
jgi:hypothetical protein